MLTKKCFMWIGKFPDQCAGKYRVWWTSGARSLSYDGMLISRLASREQAKRKARSHAVIETTAKARSRSFVNVGPHRASADGPSTPPVYQVDDVYPNGPVKRLLASAGPAGVETALVARPKVRPPVVIGALEYEHTRSSDPDHRDEEDQEIARLILTACSELAEECAGSPPTPQARSSNAPSEVP